MNSTNNINSTNNESEPKLYRKDLVNGMHSYTWYTRAVRPRKPLSIVEYALTRATNKERHVVRFKTAEAYSIDEQVDKTKYKEKFTKMDWKNFKCKKNVDLVGHDFGEKWESAPNISEMSINERRMFLYGIITFKKITETTGYTEPTATATEMTVIREETGVFDMSLNDQ
ncbi:hypothetical protein BDA99DRAFT_533814 [Phascolomyces articulosus]|uniref:Uncharacterized protein n=1 Tax=Phascolomyces articulosus TaxID=60185 RepID=A0AAD5K7R0_9FUNG|nr:hypothetical protein BDA99DRAFT_533814 [Phascolomyces articulosus]